MRPFLVPLLVLLAVPAVAAAQGGAVAGVVAFASLDPRYGQRECDVGPAPVAPCRVRVPWTEAALRARWAREGAPVWQDGDTLTFVHEGASVGVRTCCTVQYPLSPLVGTGLWVLSVRAARLDEAALSYGFVPEEVRRLVGQGVWRGPRAPAAPPRAEELAGTLQRDTLDMGAPGGERRAVTTYLPPGYRRGSGPGGLRVVYAADGESVAALAAQIEPYVRAGAQPPVAIVGVHAGPHRTEEYTAVGPEEGAADHALFLAHEAFVVDVVLPWAEWTLGVTSARERRAVFGFSNGAVFAAAMALRHPDLFGSALPFSCGPCESAVPERLPPGDGGPRPRFYFLAGVLEPRFHRSTVGAAGRLAAGGYEAPFHERVGGHDPLMWNEGFAAAVRWAFGG